VTATAHPTPISAEVKLLSVSGVDMLAKGSSHVPFVLNQTVCVSSSSASSFSRLLCSWKAGRDELSLVEDQRTDSSLSKTRIPHLFLEYNRAHGQSRQLSVSEA
jgi:hypothetical protein